MTLVLAGAEPVAGTGTGTGDGSKLDRLHNTGPDEDVQARWRFISLILAFYIFNTCPDTGTEYQVWPDTGYTYGLAEYPVRQDS